MEDLIKEKILQNYIPFNIDNRFKRNQTNINIEGIDIYFPYTLYENQIQYMKKIIELLNNKINNINNGFGALESPTGTGKTLCLLCSTLAWMNEMRAQKRYGGKILYTTRTHSQITQIIHELQKTCYRPKTAILSSRDNSCVNENVKKNVSGTILNIKCRKIYKKCPYYIGGKDFDDDKNEKYNMIDIEDLCKNGKKFQFCPFYQQIEIAKKNSDIIFMPYNYIFDEDIRNIMEIDVDNNIIIIDEAHNVRKVCEDSKSVEIKSNDFDDINSDFDSLINFDENIDFIDDFLKNRKKKKSPLNEISKNDFESEKDAIIKIQKRFNNTYIINENWGNKINYKEFFNIFIEDKEKSTDNKVKKEIKYKDDELSSDSKNHNYSVSDYISISNLKQHIEFLHKVSMIFQDVYEKGTKINILLKIFTIISQLENNKSLQKSYTFYFENEKKTIYNKDTSEIDKIDIIKKFNIFCFSPHIEFNDILKNNPFSIILTSGTLTPFKLFEDELNIKFKTTLENTHIVPSEQIKFSIITEYSNGTYRFDYENRNNIEMVKALGNEIINYCKNTTYGGILVFFTSYIYLNRCYKIWEDNGINGKILKYKKIFKDSSKDKNLISSLKKDPNKNYIFYSVFRGNSSEGIDFSDDCARVVICVGIPFADKTENRIKLKIDYINNMKKDNKDFIDGKEWYIADAMTAVNQSLGRVIRHINDYGVLVCIDERFKRFEKYFSLWIKEQYKINKDSNNNIDIYQFFNEQRNKFKDIIKNNNISNFKIESYKSGFNNIINFNKDTIFNNKELKNNKENKEIPKYKSEIDLNLNEDIIIEDNNQHVNNFNKKIKSKENSIKFEGSFKLNEENVNIINAKDLGYKTNYNEIYNSLLNKKQSRENEKKKINENNLIYEEWNITKDNKFNYIFDNEQKKSYELLESLKEFINNNPRDFNKILNKYKV